MDYGSGIEEYPAGVHSLIHDESQIRRFSRLFLDDFSDSNVYLFLLAARKKYSPETKVRSEILGREIIRGDRIDPETGDELVTKILKCCVPFGAYKDSDGAPIPTKALVVYCSLDPRNSILAWQETSTRFSNLMYESLRKGKTEPNLKRMDRQYISFLHKYRSKNRYLVLDVDDKAEYNGMAKHLEELGAVPTCVIETRGGYHIVLKKSEIEGNANKKIHSYIMKVNASGGEKELIEIKGDPFSPIPGTLQGGYPVKFVD